MTTDENTGAAKFRAKQRRRWVVMGVAIAAIAILGYVVGAYVGYAEGMGDPVQDYVSTPMAWALAALFLLLFWGQAVFSFKHADEVETQESHVASSIALSFYLGIFLAWEGLHGLGAAPPSQAWILFVATLAVLMSVHILLRYWPR